MVDATPRLDDAAFDDLYTRVIAPALAPHEAERLKLWKQFWSRMRLVGFGCVALGVLWMLLVRDYGAFWGPAFLGAVFGVGACYGPLGKFEGRCKAEVLSRLAEAIGLTYTARNFGPPGFDEARNLDLLPAFDRFTFEDLFSGVRRGCAFDLYEGHLEEQSNDRKNTWRTVFRGQIIRVAFPKTFLGTTVVNRQGQRRWKREGFKRVGLESSEFERAFEVFGTDQVEARYLVHPAFMARLIDLEAHSAAAQLRCAFDGGALTIVIEGRDMFEMVDVMKPLPNRELTRQGVAEIQTLFDLMDTVMDPPRPAWGAQPGSAGTPKA